MLYSRNSCVRAGSVKIALFQIVNSSDQKIFICHIRSQRTETERSSKKSRKKIPLNKRTIYDLRPIPREHVPVDLTPYLIEPETTTSISEAITQTDDFGARYKIYSCRNSMTLKTNVYAQTVFYIFDVIR